jgi:hypothetical protein
MYVGLIGFGCLLCIAAATWSFRTRHQRRLWRNASHNTEAVALVLELEDRVHELDRVSSLV